MNIIQRKRCNENEYPREIVKNNVHVRLNLVKDCHLERHPVRGTLLKWKLFNKEQNKSYANKTYIKVNKLRFYSTCYLPLHT